MPESEALLFRSLLIAFHSRGQRAGKDTAAQFVQSWCEQQGLTYQRLAFADKMKLLVAEALGIAWDLDDPSVVSDILAKVDQFKLNGQLIYWLQRPTGDPESDQASENALTGREFIINLAGDGPTTGARGLFGSDFWIDQLIPRSWTPQANVTCITDLRFPEEANRAAELGGVVVEILNPRAADPGGRSEEGLPPLYIDMTLTNDGTLEQFGVTVIKAISELARQRGLTE